MKGNGRRKRSGRSTRSSAASPRFSRFANSASQDVARALAFLSGADVQMGMLLALAVVLGGGGVGSANLNLLVQFASLAILAVNLARTREAMARAPRLFLLLAGLTIALPLVQLIPMPASWWRMLPGRDLVEQAQSLVQPEGAGAPLSLAPYRTAIAASALIPAIAVIVLCLTADDRQAARAAIGVVALGFANVVLGLLQIGSGNRVGNFYPEDAIDKQLYGTFANHSTAGLFLCIALVALLAIGARAKGGRGKMTLAIVAGGAALLVVSVILTRSRSAMSIAALILLVSAYPGYRIARRAFPRVPRGLILGGAGAVLGFFALLALFGNSFLSGAVGRFSDLRDARPLIWADARSAAERYWPVGSGVGSFDEVFQVDESLENVTGARARRAHNEYLELAIEAGGVGLSLAVAWAAWVAWRAWRGRNESDRRLRFAAAGGLACLALQSAVDFPFRNIAMLTVVGLLLGLLARSSAAPAESRPRERGIRKRRSRGDPAGGIRPARPAPGGERGDPSADLGDRP